MTIPYSLDENRFTDLGGYFGRVKSFGIAGFPVIETGSLNTWAKTI